MEMNYYSITTDIGNRKMNEASFSENKVQLYEIAVGDGGGEPYNPTTDMMALKGEQWRGLVSKLTIEQNIATVETVIPSEIGGFTIRELAVFDIDNNMIAIGNTPETPKVSNEEGIINEMKLQMEFSLINTDVLELKTDPNILTATKADVQELKERLENPEFDDSGEVEEISSFTDFIGSVKSKMNIFQFFKNFKAGLKYIVHTGQAVNNVTTTEPGFYLDGRVGKFLQDQITEQNKNINFVIAAEDSIPTLEDAIKSIWEKLPRGRYFSGEVQWKGINTIHGYVYDTPIYGAVTAFSYGQPLVTVRKVDNVFYIEKPVLNSDFTVTNCSVLTTANQITEIPNCPNSSNYVPVITGYSNTHDYRATISFTNGKWRIFSDVSQPMGISFYRLPSV